MAGPTQTCKHRPLATSTCMHRPGATRAFGSACGGHRSHLRASRLTLKVAAQAIAEDTGTSSSSASSLTEQMFDRLAENNRADEQAGGAGGATTLEDLRKMDKIWHNIRNAPAQSSSSPPSVVSTSGDALDSKPEYDVVICGGTLGIFLATALQRAGVNVAVVERGKLKGRAQEWNVSRAEMQSLVRLGVFSEAELDQVLGLEFNPVRVGFKGGEDIWTRDVLNLGVKPDVMVPLAAERFRSAGGVVLDETAAAGFTVHPNGISISRGEGEKPITARMLLDCMGHSSPIVRQLRHGQKPDGVCCVVGSLSSGFPKDKNSTSDLIATDQHMRLNEAGKPYCQYFWEAFPAGAGPTHRTTYMFSYLDADPRRPSLEHMLEDYWKLMPQYQDVPLDSLAVQRILFGFFPTYRNSPLPPGFDRVLQVGDASGIQSPLSFGGFGALTRHLPRLVPAITEALEADALDKRSLKRINAYNPGLSSAWMLQKAMSVRAGGEDVQPDLINRMLSANFGAMAASGDAVMRPFLQDVMKFGPFARTVAGQMARDPLFIPALLRHVGVLAMLDWFKNFVMMGLYELTYVVVRPLRRKADQGKWGAGRRFRVKRWIEALEFGSGRDH